MTRNNKGQFARAPKQNGIQYISWQQFIYTLLAVITLSTTIILSITGDLKNSIREADIKSTTVQEKANIQADKISSEIKSLLYSLDKRLTRIEDKIENKPNG